MTVRTSTVTLAFRQLCSAMTNASTELTTEEATRRCTEFRKAAFEVPKDITLMKRNLEQCIAIMRSYSNAIEVQNSGTLALVALCEKHQLEEFIGKQGGIEALLLALKHFKDNERVVKHVLIAFRSLFVCVSNRERFRIHDGLKLLVGTMKLHPQRSGVQKVSCHIVRVLASEPEVYRFRVVESGVIPLIIRILTGFDIVRDARMQLHACVILRNLTSNPTQCQQVVKVDREMASVAYVIQRSQDLEVVLSALYIFQNVMAHHGVVSFPLVTHRNITATLLAFLDHSSRAPIKYVKCHELSFSLLRSCLLRKDIRKNMFIWEDRLLKQCLSYTREYLQTEGIRQHAVLGHTCACIRMLLFDDRNRFNFRDMPESIETLVLGISVLSSRPIRVEQALLALGNAVFDSEQAQERVHAAEGIRIVGEAMKENHFSAPVTIACLQAFHAICAKNCRMVDNATSLSIQALCVESLNIFKDNPNVQESGLATIATLGQTESGAQAICRTSVLTVASRASGQFPYSQKILLLTQRIQALVEGEIVENFPRSNLALRLIRKFSSRSNAEE